MKNIEKYSDLCYDLNQRKCGESQVLTLFERIKKRRKELGYTQRELADKLGYNSDSTIAKIEKGCIDLTRGKIIAFAQVLETTPSELLGLDESETEIESNPNGFSIEIAKKIEQLTPQNQKSIEDIINSLLLIQEDGK